MVSSSRLTAGNQGDHRESRPFPSTVGQGVHSDQDRHGPELSEHAVADSSREQNQHHGRDFLLRERGVSLTRVAR
jgi:hypothetical protein